jgi:DNA segregation ATPase FtsK/SpoIIIE, S-DNA-T family
MGSGRTDTENAVVMTTETASRGAGLESPPFVEIVVDRPPALPRRAAGSLARLMPAVTVVASLGAAAAVLVSGQAGLHNPMLLLFPVTMAVSAVGAIAAGGGAGQRSADLDADRRCYLDYLTGLSRRLSEDAAALRDWLASQHPAPEALWTMVGGPDMWMRMRGEPGFCVVRVGVGAVAPSTRLIGPDRAGHEEHDPVTVAALARLLRAHGEVTDAPVTIELTAASTVTVVGETGRARALLRAMVCQLAVLHSPADLSIAAVVGQMQREHWEWLKWLPHHRHPGATDGGTAPMRANDARALGPRGHDDRRTVVIVDTDAVGPSADPHIPDPHTTVLRLGPGDFAGGDIIRVIDGAGATILDHPDQMTTVQALAVARRIAGHGPRADRTGGSSDWLERMGIANPSGIDPERLWENGFGDQLRVPIGTAEHGNPVDLDIREAAAGGMGPHGLCLGATGSGKSELLRTIVLGMIARHSPDALNLILVDFKGGATFLDLGNTRHTAAVITNLADESYLVDRMAEALTGEVDRRQRILRGAGNLASSAEYGQARRAGRSLAPLPALFIVVDEFSELLSRHPEFIDVFIAIGRLGRSLGMHLLLASQRLDEGRLRGLDSHLSYRLCLKTLSANESRTAIGSPDAYHLPSAPGAAYLKVADGEPLRFQASFVSGRLEPARTRRDIGAVARAPQLFTSAAPMGGIATERSASGGTGPTRTLLQCLVAGLGGTGIAAHQVWLPPLVESPRLETW